MVSFYVALLTLVSIVTFTSSSYVTHHTSSGGICTEACEYHGYAYTWCKQSGGNGKNWDYCSLEEGLDASGKQCASPCDLWGGKYRYCHLKNGEWNYCGLLGEQDFSEYSQGNHICITRCQVDGGSFHCKTAGGSDRCSPFRDVTPDGLPCHENYRCARYGNPEYRCHIDDSESSWDHCGRKGLDGCKWASSESNSSQIEICTHPDVHKEGKIIFCRERRDNVHPPTNEEFKNAIHLIDKIVSTTSFRDPGTEETVYFHKQEDIVCKNISYTNVEIWSDVAMERANPIARVVFPASLSSAHILRWAFYTSLHSTFYQPAYTIGVAVDEPMLCSISLQ